jgi:hypothetical protein
MKQWQSSPQTVTAARLADDGASRQAALPPTANGGYWVPGGQVSPAANLSTTRPKPVKDVTIRPTAPPTATSGATVPVYPPQGTLPPPQGSLNHNPPAGQLTSASDAPKKVKEIGRLYRDVRYDRLNPLYYLANSQGTATYFVRAWTNSGLDLNRHVGNLVEVEGQLVDRRSDPELGHMQINADQVREIR